MTAPGACAAIVLAAGCSRRFGAADKLLAPCGDRPLAGHIAETVGAIPFAQHIAATANPETGDLFANAGFEIVIPHNASPSQGASLRASLGTVRDARYVLVCLADMPHITTRHLTALLDAHGASNQSIATSAQDYRGPPALFAVDALRALPLDTDQGARPLLQTAIFISARSEMVLDVDRPEDLVRLAT